MRTTRVLTATLTVCLLSGASAAVAEEQAEATQAAAPLQAVTVTGTRRRPRTYGLTLVFRQ